MHRVGLIVLSLGLVSACGGDTAIAALEFDGSECTANLPASVAAGTHSFVLTNTSDLSSVPVYVVELSDDYSYGELAALQSSPGEYFPLPEWATYALRELNITDDDEEVQRRRFAFALEPGDYAVYLWASRPAAIWLCGSLSVTPGSGER